MGDVKAAAERTKCFVCWSIWNSLADDEQSRLMQSQDSVSGDPAQAQSTESANNFGQQSYRSSYQLSMDASSSCSRATDARIIRSVSEAHWHMEVRIRTDFLIGEAPGPIKDSYFIIEPCHIPARNGWNPTRLIEVGNVASGTVKVITTISIDHELAYFTLSHRWVDSDALKLTRHTHLDFSRGIAVAELPKKFQDAIHVARLFGRRYLWIDSLCILQDQDDKSDWIRESTQMDKVYMHGDCNLSAIGAVDGPGGLFQNRRPDMLFSQAAFVPPDQDGSGTYQIMIARDEEWVSEASINVGG
ncbi:hypothetical protein PRZ48_006130 [Zasmidium cellare]|uniref:Heterokaryon incompatibility domain-containing protein n=1 Tax=Zasmidium cellare TaxID=395010 RepID=A0ABR0EMA1_ZASCE|nr:hypothetical protein PRZ48_006130 [Zasmidium cellare]